MLTVTGKDEKQERRHQRLASGVGPDFVESKPGTKRGRESDHQRNDLPKQWIRRNQTCGDEKDRSEERTEAAEGGNEFSRAEEFCDPGERPIVPIKAGEREQESISEDGRNCKRKGYAFAGEPNGFHDTSIIKAISVMSAEIAS